MSQRQKNVTELHAAARSNGIFPILEVSSNSDMEVGRKLSAFNLEITIGSRKIAFESAYQGSKVFDRGGPFTDIYELDARAAKKDPRIRESGRIVAFEFMGQRFPSDPPTAFYDWMYICTLYPYQDWLRRLASVAAFSDIAFNPERSLNCQARSCAMFVALQARNLLGHAAESFQSFLEIASVTERNVHIGHWTRAS